MWFWLGGDLPRGLLAAGFLRLDGLNDEDGAADEALQLFRGVENGWLAFLLVTDVPKSESVQHGKVARTATAASDWIDDLRRAVRD
jgi:hypothetical protein